MKIIYKEKEYEIVKVEETCNNKYFFIVYVENPDEFNDLLLQINLDNESEFKEDYEGAQGLIPIELLPEKDILGRTLGKFKLDTWVYDKNKEAFYEVKTVKEKLYQKCKTCENFGPYFGICFKNKIGPGWSSRGICDYYEVIDDGYISEITDEELMEEGFFEF